MEGGQNHIYMIRRVVGQSVAIIQRNKLTKCGGEDLCEDCRQGMRDEYRRHR